VPSKQGKQKNEDAHAGALESLPLEEDEELSDFFFVQRLSIDVLLVFPAPADIVSGFACCVFCFTYSLTGFAFGLLGKAFSLGFFIASPLAGLALRPAGNIFDLSLNAVLIHKNSSPSV
jgi:hypothetical protein